MDAVEAPSIQETLGLIGQGTDRGRAGELGSAAMTCGSRRDDLMVVGQEGKDIGPHAG